MASDSSVVQTRRTFLKEVSAAAALGVMTNVPGRLLWAKPTELLPEPDETLLRELALAAVDAARTAGATFADVRVTAGRQIYIVCDADWRLRRGPGMDWPELTISAGYGIRAIVDGVWGFAGGSELTPDAVRGAAQMAVARARSSRPRRPRALELATVPPAEKGTWATPIELDPFDVPVGEQADIALAALTEAGRVEGIHSALVQFRWTRNIRVFASSEDALIVQRMALALPGALASVDRTRDALGASEGVTALRAGAYGYEALARVNLNEELREAAERAVAESKRPLPPTVEVGRYDLVFGAPAVASLLTTTIAAALNAERALGYEANNEGTSFAAPPKEVLGRFQVGTPLLTVRADRTRVHGAATVRWDDEGVRAGEHTLVRKGIIVDYLTNRQTAAELAEWYGSQREAVRSRGCASGAGQFPPAVRLPNLTMAPGKDDLSADDLIADTKRGFYIEHGRVVSDQQVLNMQGWTRYRGVREIRNGKLGSRIRDLAFQSATPRFWQSMDAIGGAASMTETLQATGFPAGDPLQLPFATVEAVPARVREVNVLNYGITL